MNDEASSSVPKVFYWISGAALVWNLIGIAAYVGQVTMSAETLAALPDDQRALYENVPTWVTSAFAIAVNAGAIGCLLLLLRKSLALPLLIVSMALLVGAFRGRRSAVRSPAPRRRGGLAATGGFMRIDRILLVGTPQGGAGWSRARGTRRAVGC